MSRANNLVRVHIIFAEGRAIEPLSVPSLSAPDRYRCRKIA